MFRNLLVAKPKQSFAYETDRSYRPQIGRDRDHLEPTDKMVVRSNLHEMSTASLDVCNHRRRHEHAPCSDIRRYANYSQVSDKLKHDDYDHRRREKMQFQCGGQNLTRAVLTALTVGLLSLSAVVSSSDYHTAIVVLICISSMLSVLFVINFLSASLASGASRSIPASIVSQLLRVVELSLSTGAWYAVGVVSVCHTQDNALPSPPAQTDSDCSLFDDNLAFLLLNCVFEMTFIVGGVGFVALVPNHSGTRLVAWVAVVAAAVLKIHAVGSIGHTVVHSVRQDHASLPV